MTASKKRPKRARPKKKAPAGTVHINRGEGPYYEAMASAVAPLDPMVDAVVSGRFPVDAQPDEPPPSLIPPDVQQEIDRLKRFNRALCGALRAFMDEEP